MKLHPYQVGGFVVGEGCFYIDISRDSSYSCGYQSRLGFEIELREDDREILEEIQNQLSCGNIYRLEYDRYKKWKPHVKYRVSNFREINEKVIPYFKEGLLFGKKHRQFDLFCEAAVIIEQGLHKVTAGVEKLRDIKRRMNEVGKKLDSLDAGKPPVQWERDKA